MLKNLLLLSAFSTFAVIVIVALNIYHGYTLSSLPIVTQQRVVSIPSSFDKQTIAELKKRTSIPVDLIERTKVISEDSKDTSAPTEPTQSQQASNSATPL